MSEKKQKALRTRYAVPCKGNESGEFFFVTFNTRDEREALKLASCVQGKSGKKALVVINENGDIFHVD